MNGQENFGNVTSSFYHNAQGAYIVCDCTDQESAKAVKMWAEQVDRSAPNTCKVAVIVNKVDDASKRCVTKESVEDVAKVIKDGAKVYETSATENTGVVEAFEGLAGVIVEAFVHKIK